MLRCGQFPCRDNASELFGVDHISLFHRIILDRVGQFCRQRVSSIQRLPKADHIKRFCQANQTRQALRTTRAGDHTKRHFGHPNL